MGIHTVQHYSEKDQFLGNYDVIFYLETIARIEEKLKLLRAVRKSAKKLILSASCIADGSPLERVMFGGQLRLTRLQSCFQR